MIRPAIKSDLTGIKQLMRSEPGLWQDSWREDVLERALDATHGLAFVWEERAQILGFVCAHDVGFRGYLSELIVAASSRCRGIGRRLVEHVERELKSRDCTVLISDVWRGAETFYRSLGWSKPDVVLLRKNLATKIR